MPRRDFLHDPGAPTANSVMSSVAAAVRKPTGPRRDLRLRSPSVVRNAENKDTHGRRWPRGKAYDDATILRPPVVYRSLTVLQRWIERMLTTCKVAGAVVAETPTPGEPTTTLGHALEVARPAEVADRSTPDSRRFEELAMRAWAGRRHTGPRDTKLVLVAGFAGSGKTEFAKFLSTVTGWALLDKDTLTRPLVESMLTALNADPNDRHSEIYRQVRPVEYRCLTNATFSNIENGISTVVTAPFLAEVTDPQWLRRLLHRCAAANAHPEIVWVGADAETMHTYLQRRDAVRDTWKLNHWDEYLAQIDIATRPQIPHFYVDNSLNSAVQLTDEALRILEWISR